MCTQPIRAWLCYDYEMIDGVIKFGRRPTGYNRVDEIDIPCGHCLECTEKKKRDWTARACCEYELHDSSCFLTLTYSPEKLPQNGDLVRPHWKEFADLLRVSIKRKYNKNLKVVLFGCGEYGGKPGDPVITPAGRPHFHCCVFGFDFPDRYEWSRSHKGFPIYRSPFLESIWKRGHSTIQPLEYGDLAYCAGYVEKKALKRASAERNHCGNPYLERGKMFVDAFGCVHPAEFTITPSRPALGKKWLEKYFNDAYPSGFIVVCGKKFTVPRYFDKIAKEKDPGMFLSVKLERLQKAQERSEENTPERRAAREELLRLKFERSRSEI